MDYKQILKKQKEREIEKQKLCAHDAFIDDTIYKKCKACGKLVAMRTPDDVAYRGFIGRGYDFDSQNEIE